MHLVNQTNRAKACQHFNLLHSPQDHLSLLFSFSYHPNFFSWLALVYAAVSYQIRYQPNTISPSPGKCLEMSATLLSRLIYPTI